MLSRSEYSLRTTLLITLLPLAVSACNPRAIIDRIEEKLDLGSTEVAGQSESDMADDTYIESAENEDGDESPRPLSPLEQHMLARRQVDPRDTRTKHNYTIKVPRGGFDELEKSGRLEWAKYGGVPPEKLVSSKAMVHALTGRKPNFDEAVAEPEKPIAAGFSGLKPTTIKIASPESTKTKNPQVQAKPVATQRKEKHANVHAIRLGEHPGKTRLVMDLDARSDFSFDSVDDKNLMFITLAGTGWQAEKERVFKDHPLIMAYLVEETEEGDTVLAIRTRVPCQVVFKTYFPPNDSKGHRIVFDIAAI